VIMSKPLFGSLALALLLGFGIPGGPAFATNAEHKATPSAAEGEHRAAGHEQTGEARGEGAGEEEEAFSEVLMHHITDGNTFELPAFNGHMAAKFDTREIFGNWDLRIGDFTLKLTPTKLTLFLWLSALIVFLLYGVISPRRYDSRGVPLGWNNLLEVFVLFVRDEIAIANIGKKEGPRYTPYLCTVFVFILVMNFVGLFPFGATATGNLMVTGALALISFGMTTLAGMRAHGAVGYWTSLVPSGVPPALWPLMWPIEFVGLFTKPFALTVRLFANMTAGHVVILSLLGLIFVQKSLAWVPVSVPFALFIYLLEILVALLQAYIFAMLTALFIGLASHDH